MLIGGNYDSAYHGAVLWRIFANALIAMHQLRYRVFKERLDWEVHTSGDMEFDSFDALHPAYLVQVATDGQRTRLRSIASFCRTDHAS